MSNSTPAPRKIEVTEYPKSVYLEATILFFGSNFVYHMAIHRSRGSFPHFAAFMVVNAFTSYQLAECMNMGAIRHYAARFQNLREVQHRNKLTEQLRLKIINRNSSLQ